MGIVSDHPPARSTVARMELQRQEFFCLLLWQARPQERDSNVICEEELRDGLNLSVCLLIYWKYCFMRKGGCICMKIFCIFISNN